MIKLLSVSRYRLKILHIEEWFFSLQHYVWLQWLSQLIGLTPDKISCTLHIIMQCPSHNLLCIAVVYLVSLSLLANYHNTRACYKNSSISWLESQKATKSKYCSFMFQMFALAMASFCDCIFYVSGACVTLF